MPPIPKHKNRKSKTNKQSSGTGFKGTNRSGQAAKNSQKNSHSTAKMSKGLVRIIAGTHRGRRLPVLVNEGLRPTSDRVKETLFNWLMQHTANAVCLDMFAGSAGLGIEALSRGAQHVVFVELDKTVILQIQKNIETLGESQHSSVVSGDALKLDLQAPLETLKLEGKLTQSTFDLVFIDPPFGHDLAPKALQNIIEQKLLAENAYVYIELGHDDELVIPPQFDVHKQIKTSQVHAHLLIYKP